MVKYISAQCYFCGEKTEHKILSCDRSLALRVLRGIVTLGVSEAFGNTYECKCLKCGHVNEILM